MSIFVRLQGGLGNQMFQYAAGRALAACHGTELVLDDTLLNGRRIGVTPRRLEVAQFPIAARLLSVPERRDIGRETSLVRRLLDRAGISAKPPRVFRELNPRFREEFYSQPDMTILDGYWQSERYFCGIRAELLREFAVPIAAGSAQAQVRDEVRDSASVSVHVRRGDYVTNIRASAFHGVMDIAYYARALRLISDRVGRLRPFVFSDDPKWVSENLDIGVQFVNVSANGFRAVDELMLMRSCSHHVIANSSFSWWGAWLNSDPRKLVVAPKQWFRAEPQPLDLIPDAWWRA